MASDISGQPSVHASRSSLSLAWSGWKSLRYAVVGDGICDFNEGIKAVAAVALNGAAGGEAIGLGCVEVLGKITDHALRANAYSTVPSASLSNGKVSRSLAKPWMVWLPLGRSSRGGGRGRRGLDAIAEGLSLRRDIGLGIGRQVLLPRACDGVASDLFGSSS